MNTVKKKRSMNPEVLAKGKAALEQWRKEKAYAVKKGGKFLEAWNEEQELKKAQKRTSPMQAILHIDMALDHNLWPSQKHVEMIMKPGRLGRRRETLRRILSECFDLRGKCVPNPNASGDGGEEPLMFVTQCGIDELGAFVLAKLTQ